MVRKRRAELPAHYKRLLQGMAALLETGPETSALASNAAKLRRWARAYERRVAPEIIVVRTECHGTFVFEGWLLGRGAQGRGMSECGNEWRRREATIYITSDGAVLCKHVWVGTGGNVTTSVLQYENDLELLWPMGLDGREDADECVKCAARQAVTRCEVFGVFGVTWVHGD